MQTCYEIPEYQIKLEQCDDNSFRVAYGLQVTDHLSYESAAKEIGACLMHAMACEGLLNNSED